MGHAVLEEHDYEVVYRKGALNTNRDALSRINSLIAGMEAPEKKRVRVTDETKATISYEHHDSPGHE